MSAAAPALPRPRIGDADRLGATMVLSVLLHALVILGIGFTLREPAPVAPALDVILSESQNLLTPEQADFLAQANHAGGGEHDRAQRPREPQTGQLPVPEAGLTPQVMSAQAPEPQPVPEARVVTSTAGTTPQPAARDTVAEADPTLPDGRRKVSHDMEMARLAAEIHLRSEAYARRPSRKFVSASTREYAWAGYLRQWVDRVERIGNLNYPDEARRRRIGGVVVINVGVRRNGTLESAHIVQSSHIPMLDQAALRIAELAAPYPPLPQTEENPDVLNVVRTWQFLPGGEMVDL
ncbi:MAG: TonB family protein [Pseudoxanthomonas suwonensis]|nr:TonB family protein [Pseudoxanthomonas suwonensis]